MKKIRKEPGMDQPLLEEETLSQKIYVKDLEVGNSIHSIFAVTRFALREYDRGKFLTLRLGDNTGKVNAILWDHAEETSKQLQDGIVVEIDGKVNSYKDELQITLKSIHPLADCSHLNPRDFLQASPIPQETLISEFEELIAGITDPDYHALLSEFRQDERLWGKFILAPGAKLWHHPYIYGLLEHTLSVMKLCRLIAPMYPHVDSDLLIAGAVFHDMGKIDEFVFDFRIDYSTDGRLLGHTFIGTLIVERLITQLPSFPEEKRRLLLHLILSHHGEIERSPILPMTLEACLLHHIENMDAQMAALGREMNNVRSENKEWTGFVNLIQRYLYLGENSESEDNE
jgi:3'-5' exoribonuclease